MWRDYTECVIQSMTKYSRCERSSWWIRRRPRLSITYPQTTGRNFDEILRVVDSLQLTDRHSVSRPVNWHSGEDVIIVPSVSDNDARERFPKGWGAHGSLGL